VDNNTVKTSLRDYFRVLCYWKGTVAVLFLAIVLTVIAGTYLLPPVYEAFTLILVEREQRFPMQYKGYETATIPPQLSVAEERMELAKTQSEIVKSRYIMERIVLNFELDKGFEEPNQIEKAIEDLRNRTDVELKEETNIIVLMVEDEDPVQATKLTNAIAEEYVKWTSEVKKTKTKGASGTLSERVSVLDKELEQAEDELNRLKKRGGVSALKEEITSTVNKLADFKAEYDFTIADIKSKKARLDELEAVLEEAGGEDLIALSDAVDSRVVDALKLKLLELKLKRTELSSKYREDTSPLESVNFEIDQTEEKLQAEIEKVVDAVVNSTKADLAALEARRTVLESVKDDYSKRLQQLSDVELEYKRLERQVAGKNELYLTLLGKQAEASLVEAVKTGLLINVRIVDPAKIPLEPVRPKKVLNIVLGCIIGMICSVSGAFLREYWDHSIKSVNEVGRYLELPTLATIQKARGRSFSLYTPGSPISESFHSLSSSIQQICKDRGLNTLLVTSAARKEGKSVVAANLAVSLAGIEGKKVLIIDANLRNPVMHRFFEVKVKSNLKESFSSKDRAIIADVTEIDNLHLISTTEEVSEPSRLFASEGMRQFLRRVKTEYDYVIIDTPALVPYPDSSLLGFEAEGIILVVQFGQTRREVIERAKSLLDKSQRKILGVVLNKMLYVIPSTLYKRI